MRRVKLWRDLKLVFVSGLIVSLFSPPFSPLCNLSLGGLPVPDVPAQRGQVPGPGGGAGGDQALPPNQLVSRRHILSP